MRCICASLQQSPSETRLKRHRICYLPTMLADAIDLTTVKRALVIKLRHHGDVLLTSPVFQTLKNHAPHIEIDALVLCDAREMLTGHRPLVKKCSPSTPDGNAWDWSRRPATCSA